MERKIIVNIQQEDFDSQNISKELCEGNLNVGGLVCFTGICRGENDEVKALELEHYPDMAQKQLETIAKQACDRWSLIGVAVVHRFGRITPGENIVCVVAAAEHRLPAFEAAQFTMDFLKTDAPFWKKEEKNNDDENKWVEEKNKDIDAKEKWN